MIQLKQSVKEKAEKKAAKRGVKLVMTWSHFSTGMQINLITAGQKELERALKLGCKELEEVKKSSPGK